VSRNWLTVGFCARYGLAVASVDLSDRIAEARALILATHLPLVDIVRGVGLPDPQHLNKRFKTCGRHPPSHLRRARGAAFGVRA